MTTSEDDIDTVLDSMPEEIRRVVNSMIQEHKNLVSKLKDLHRLHDMMNNNSAFTQQEAIVVQQRISVIQSTCDRINKQVKAKIQLYTGHVATLNVTINKRKELLKDFDEILSSENTIADIVIQQQLKLEDELVNMTDALNA